MTNETHSKATQIVANARRLGKDAFHTSVALDLVAPVEGRTWTAVCCSCLDRIAPDLADAFVHRVSMTITQSAGGCMLCPYTGCDTLVAAIEVK